MSVVLPVFIAFFAGFLVVLNRVGNVRINQKHSLLTTVTINHVVGFLALLLVVSTTRDKEFFETALAAPLWHQSSGILGVIFLCCAVASIREMGVLRSTLLIIAGQMVGTYVIDLSRNRFDSPGIATVGIGLVILGIIVNQFRRRGKPV
ncbi:MAG: DMT family transporter [Bdellovibrionales bacterium]|nr:DMT family transporter [Bdellovibrionales bacterium]